MTYKEKKPIRDETLDNSKEICTLKFRLEWLEKEFYRAATKKNKRDICLYGCFFTGSILIILGQLLNYLKG